MYPFVSWQSDVFHTLPLKVDGIPQEESDLLKTVLAVFELEVLTAPQIGIPKNIIIVRDKVIHVLSNPSIDIAEQDRFDCNLVKYRDNNFSGYITKSYPRYITIKGFDLSQNSEVTIPLFGFKAGLVLSAFGTLRSNPPWKIQYVGDW